MAKKQVAFTNAQYQAGMAQIMTNAFAEHVSNLLYRWEDEREYEDIAEYGKAMAQRLPKSVKMIKPTKRPFGFHFVFADDVAARRFKFTMSPRGKYACASL